VRAAFAVVLFACGCGARSEIRGGGTEPSVDAGSDAQAHGCTLIATTAVHPDAIAIDDAFIYFHDDEGIWRLSKSGSTPVKLASATATLWPDLSPMSLSGGFVFYTDADTLTRVPVTGGASVSFGENGPMLGVAANAADVWFWSRGPAPDFPISRVTLAGIGEPDVADLDEPPGKIFFGDTTAFAVADPGVFAIGLNGGSQLLYGLSAVDVVADDDDVYFTSSDATNGARIMQLSKKTLAATKIAGSEGAYALAIGNGDLYFTDRTNSHVRRIIGKVGQAVDIVSISQNYSPIDIAVDDQCVYFTAAGAIDGLLMAAPRH
jgi:hypothetical protein